MKVGRNDPCPCGSGKKYKNCCWNKTIPETPSNDSITSAPNDLSIKQRNLILFDAIGDIFGFANGKQWEDIKKDISGDQIKELYKIVGWLWPPGTNLIPLLPKPDRRLRSLYVGLYRPELILQNIVRHSLYTDEIIVINPLLNPWRISPTYNPLIHPEKYKEDTLSSIAFILQLEPWIESNIVNLIPDPGNFDYQLRRETWKLAEERCKDLKLSKEDEEDLMPYMMDVFKRTLIRAPKESLITNMRRWKPDISDKEIEGIIRYIDKMKQEDPLVLNQPIEKEGQILITRTGVNLEMGLYIAQTTGAYLYTDLRRRWREILSTADKLPKGGNVWSPLSKAFQSLDFRFLNNVDPEFACTVRHEGRLEGFRSFLRKIWSSIEGNPDPKSVDKLSRDFSDELTDEFHKTEAEWKSIDQSLLRWTTSTGGVATAISSIIRGGMSWEIPAGGFCMAAVGQLLTARMQRSRFRKSIPLSVFIDLKRK